MEQTVEQTDPNSSAKAPSWSRAPRSCSRALEDPAEETGEPHPTTFHTKLIHFVICSWEPSQASGSTIPNHNEISIIGSQDQSQMMGRNDYNSVVVCSFHGVSVQELLDSENLSIGWFHLSSIQHSFCQQQLTLIRAGFVISNQVSISKWV